MQKIDTVIFDLDGTLADTAEDIQQALAQALAAHDLPPIDTRTVRFLVGGGERVLIMRALERLCVDPNTVDADGLVAAFHHAYLDRRNRDSRLYPGVQDGIARLHARGIRLGVCSNKPQDLSDRLVADLGIVARLGAVIGAREDLPRKPDPAGLRRCMAALEGTPQTTLYVGDSETDVATARAAGCRVAIVDYGYSARPASQLGADRVIASIADLGAVTPISHTA